MSKQASADQHSRFALLLLVISMVSLSERVGGATREADFLRGFVQGLSVVGLGALTYVLVRATTRKRERA